METIIALGSNQGDRLQSMRKARHFLKKISTTNSEASPIYLTEPVGPSRCYFLNAVIAIQTARKPEVVLSMLQKYEQYHGRPEYHPRWSARTIDLDIIAADDLVIESDTLIIPHPEYHKRLFVLQPLHNIRPHWHDPETGISISAMMKNAPALQLKKTTLSWMYGK